ncbi:IPT/TIG domain-containing protein [Nocardia paucivorans]|uniref:IPT/TIG domain-containing protein n=1 Tax=Nocardia paucivorans TaxID=114259 RepID=UPI000592DD0D|nr:IPT/TIG domain-containing protein [Nocardia paucivorans]
MPPTITSLSPTSGPTAGGNNVIITGSGFVGPASVLFGGTATIFTIDSPTRITALAPPGTGTVQVVVTTPEGSSNGVPYTYAGAPSLSGVSPSQGPTSGGNTVTLTGANLATATAVRFGVTPAVSFTVVSAGQITATAPPGAGTVQVTVTTPSGTSNGISYTYVAAPTLSGVSPNQGPTAGGNTVTLTGANLAGATMVRFGVTPAVSFTVVSDGQITATVPAGCAGVVDITVVTPGGSGTLAGSYFYLNTPAFTGIVPDSGPLAGGDTVTLTGTDLVAATAVHFGVTPAASFTVVSAGLITATTPPGTGTVEVTVTTPGGTSNAISYTYLPTPTVTESNPGQGPTAGGNTVTLTGSALARTNAVLFGATPAAFAAVSDNHLVAVAPAGAAGPTPITVTTPGGISAPVTYTRIPPPVI